MVADAYAISIFPIFLYSEGGEVTGCVQEEYVVEARVAVLIRGFTLNSA